MNEMLNPENPKEIQKTLKGRTNAILLILLAVVVCTSFLAWGAIRLSCNSRVNDFKEAFTTELRDTMRDPSSLSIDWKTLCLNKEKNRLLAVCIIRRKDDHGGMNAPEITLLAGRYEKETGKMTFCTAEAESQPFAPHERTTYDSYLDWLREAQDEYVRNCRLTLEEQRDEMEKLSDGIVPPTVTLDDDDKPVFSDSSFLENSERIYDILERAKLIPEMGPMHAFRCFALELPDPPEKEIKELLDQMVSLTAKATSDAKDFLAKAIKERNRLLEETRLEAAKSTQNIIEMLTKEKNDLRKALAEAESERKAEQERVKKVIKEAETEFDANPDPVTIDDIIKRFPRIAKGDMCEFTDRNGNLLKGKLAIVVKGKYIAIESDHHQRRYPWSVLPSEISAILLGDYEEFVLKRAKYEFVRNKFLKDNRLAELDEECAKIRIALENANRLTWEKDEVEDITWFQIEPWMEDTMPKQFVFVNPYFGITGTGRGILRIVALNVSEDFIIPRSLILQGDGTIVRIEVNPRERKSDYLKRSNVFFESCDVFASPYLDDLLQIAQAEKITVRLDGHSDRYTYEMTRHNHLAKNLSSPASTAHSFDFQYGDGFGNLAYRELSNAYSQIDMLRIREENAFRRIIFIYAKLRKMKAMR